MPTLRARTKFLQAAFLQAALDYAHEGRPVFPLHSIDACGVCTCGGPEANPRCNPGKHPRIRRWPEQATTNPEQIKAWWLRWPDANIGIPTGEPSGLLVLDHDTFKPETLPLEEVEAQLGRIPTTRTHVTGRGGMQYLFEYPHGSGIRNSVGELGPGLDVRGDGGYVVAPPSVTEGPYTVLKPLPLAGPPTWLTERLKRPSGSRTSPHSKASGSPPKGEPLAHSGEPIPEGRRNNTLASIAGHRHDGTRDLPTLTAELLEINAERCAPPLPDGEVEGIARSIHRRKPCKRVTRPPSEVLDFVTRHRTRILRQPWTGRAGPTDHDGYETLLDVAEQHGRITQSGNVSIRLSVRDYAMRAGVTYSTAHKSLQRLQQRRLLYRLPRMTNGEAGVLVLRNIATQGSISQSSEGDTPMSDLPLRTLLRRVRNGAGRTGKLGELVLRAVLEATDPISTAEVAERVGRRGCDVRRTLKKLQARQLVDCVGGDSYRVADDLQHALLQTLEGDGVPQSEELQRKRDDLARDEYRNRRRVRPELHLANVRADGGIAELVPERGDSRDHDVRDETEGSPSPPVEPEKCAELVKVEGTAA